MIVVVAVYSTLMVAWLAVWQHAAKRLIGLTWKETFADVAPFLLVSIVAFAITYFATSWLSNVVILLCAKVILGAVLYFVAMKVAHVKIFEEGLQFLKQKISSK